MDKTDRLCCQPGLFSLEIFDGVPGFFQLQANPEASYT